jgi:hypothetical protein
MTEIIDYPLADITIVNGFLQQIFDTCEDFTQYIPSLKIPEYLVTHPRAPEWINIWWYLSERSYGPEKKAKIVKLFNENKLDLYHPIDFINGNDMIER